MSLASVVLKNGDLRGIIITSEFRGINAASPRTTRNSSVTTQRARTVAPWNCRLSFAIPNANSSGKFSTRNRVGWRFPSDFVSLTDRSSDYPKFHSPTRRNSRIKCQLIASRRNFGSCGPNLPGAFARNYRNYTKRGKEKERKGKRICLYIV